MLVKRRVSNGYDWVVYHKDDVAGLYLNEASNNMDSSNTNIWFHGQTPTSTQFHIGLDGRLGDNVSTGAFVAYCFAPKQGFSKFGKYTGNGNADGTFVYTGFRPAWVMCRDIANAAGWHIFDNKRSNSFNEITVRLEADNSDAENDSGPPDLDFLSNGFKFRTSFDNINRSGTTHIYMAFAEQPFVNSKGVPCNAR